MVSCSPDTNACKDMCLLYNDLLFRDKGCVVVSLLYLKMCETKHLMSSFCDFLIPINLKSEF